MPKVCVSAKKLYFSVQNGQTELSILRHVDIDAYTGEFVGIVGPNGAGKTTLLKALAGFLRVKGELLVNFNGELQPINKIPVYERAKQMCFMHQDTSVPFAFTGREVAAMGRQPWQGRFSSPGDADRKIVDEALRRADCYEFANSYVQNLSGGERQRIMLARALVQNTPTLLLDEPTSSLDIRHAQKVFCLCRQLAEHGHCVIAVLHDLRQAAEWCNRLYLMHQGEILAHGAAEEVLTPNNINGAYGVGVEVFRNPANKWDYFVK